MTKGVWKISARNSRRLGLSAGLLGVLCLVGLSSRAQVKPIVPAKVVTPVAPKGLPAVALDARQVFGTVKAAPAAPAQAIGGYALGCQAGAQELAANGEAWQVMRPSRNRAWGQPALVKYVQTLARDVSQKDGISGLLIGDIAQPLGGPMLTGHASHQVGLDADIWLKPMPTHTLTVREREDLSADNMVDEAGLAVDAKNWSEAQVKLLRRAASYPEVARIFVHPAIKKAICETAGTDRAFLLKIRPWWGHNYHFHVRLNCPPVSTLCVNQAPVGTDDGCKTEVADWFKRLEVARRAPKRPPPGPAKPFLLASLPKACQELALKTNSAALPAKPE